MMSPTLALLRAAYDKAEREHFDTYDSLIQPDASGVHHPTDRELRVLDVTARNFVAAKRAFERGRRAYRRMRRRAS